MSTYLSPAPSSATWHTPTPSTAFSHSHSQRPPRAASSSMHLPLPRADYPLLHSLLDSPEYQQAMGRYPELNRSPAPPRSTSSKRTPSTTRSSSLRRPSKAPTTAVSDVWSRKPPSSSKLSSSIVTTPESPLSMAGGGSINVPSSNNAYISSNHSQLRPPAQAQTSTRSSSPQPWSNFASLPAQTTPLLPVVPTTLHRATTSSRALASVASSTGPKHGCESLNRKLSVASKKNTPPTHRPHPASRSVPDLPRPTLPSRTFTAPSYPVRRPRDSTVSFDSSFVEVKSPSNFSNAVSHLKRMLTRKNSRRTRSNSKESSGGASTTVGSRSRSTSVFSSYIGGDGIEELVASPTTYEPASSSAALHPSQTSPSFTSSSFPVPSTTVARPSISQRHPSPTKPLQARAPIDSESALRTYVDSRKALLQLLRDGPGADVARSSPVLQASIGKAYSEKSIRTRGRFAWLANLGRTSRKGIKDEGEGKDEGSVQTKDLRRKKSVATVRSRKNSGRPQSFFGRKVSRSRSEDSFGFVDLTLSKSLDVQHRSTTAYSSYGERWENDWRERGKRSNEDKAEEDRKLWKKWRSWVRERREDS
ncbi:hypothetical protein JCM5353_008559 [Sporobolomyces roseus]